MTEFVRQESPPSTGRALQVATMVEMLRAADGPVPFEELCHAAQVRYPADIMVAMTALEIVGQVDRHTYVGGKGRHARVAYAWVDPSGAPAARTASVARSKGTGGRTRKARGARS